MAGRTTALRSRQSSLLRLPTRQSACQTRWGRPRALSGEDDDVVPACSVCFARDRLRTSRTESLIDGGAGGITRTRTWLSCRRTSMSIPRHSLPPFQPPSLPLSLMPSPTKSSFSTFPQKLIFGTKALSQLWPATRIRGAGMVNLKSEIGRFGLSVRVGGLRYFANPRSEAYLTQCIYQGLDSHPPHKTVNLISQLVTVINKLTISWGS